VKLLLFRTWQDSKWYCSQLEAKRTPSILRDIECIPCRTVLMFTRARSSNNILESSLDNMGPIRRQQYIFAGAAHAIRFSSLRVPNELPLRITHSIAFCCEILLYFYVITTFRVIYTPTQSGETRFLRGSGLIDVYVLLSLFWCVCI